MMCMKDLKQLAESLYTTLLVCVLGGGWGEGDYSIDVTDDPISLQPTATAWKLIS